MNAKNFFALLIVFALFGTACAPLTTSNSAHAINAAQSVNNHTSNLIPITGKSAPNTVQNIQPQLSQKSHSNCSSANSSHQDGCSEQTLQSGSIFLVGTGNADTHAYPSQQLHRDCVSEDNQRQDSCTE